MINNQPAEITQMSFNFKNIEVTEQNKAKVEQLTKQLGFIDEVLGICRECKNKFQLKCSSNVGVSFQVKAGSEGLGELMYLLLKKASYSALLYECQSWLKFVYQIDKEDYWFDGVFHIGEETTGEEEEEGYESAENENVASDDEEKKDIKK